ncbi:MAG: helix-hairpin-helix domain-containing protein [Acholeplasmataceae bacterium]|nr:helix-hairpin-helix domain-containing protein [Acholeplasmataceae bacterium]
MKIIIAEAISFVEHDRKTLLHARKLNRQDFKYQAIMSLFANRQIAFFLNIGQALNHKLNKETPLVFVTDWSDPTEMVGLLLEDGHDQIAYPDLGFLAFYTDWDDLAKSGIERIFSHEFSHLWLHALGFDFSLSKANTFHTITSVTNQYMAFSEGFAEHLEIIADGLIEQKESYELYDHGLNIGAWISYRDQALRRHAVNNNRFVYETYPPCVAEFSSYDTLHLAHITSSAFNPEKIKNASQMLASEGVVSSFFIHFYRHDLFKNQMMDPLFYTSFNQNIDKIDPVTNHYLKILDVLSRINMQSETLLIDFVIRYAEIHPGETNTLFKLFLDMTYYATVDPNHRVMFQDLYRVGRLGNPTDFKAHLINVRAQKERLQDDVIAHPNSLKNGLYPVLWTEGDQSITPIPWAPDRYRYIFDLNTASAIDLLSINGIDLQKAQKLIEIREKQKGFKSLTDFDTHLKNMKLSN